MPTLETSRRKAVACVLKSWFEIVKIVLNLILHFLLIKSQDPVFLVEEEKKCSKTDFFFNLKQMSWKLCMFSIIPPKQVSMLVIDWSLMIFYYPIFNFDYVLNSAMLVARYCLVCHRPNHSDRRYDAWNVAASRQTPGQGQHAHFSYSVTHNANEGVSERFIGIVFISKWPLWSTHKQGQIYTGRIIFSPRFGWTLELYIFLDSPVETVVVESWSSAWQTTD